MHEALFFLQPLPAFFVVVVVVVVVVYIHISAHVTGGDRLQVNPTEITTHKLSQPPPPRDSFSMTDPSKPFSMIYKRLLLTTS